MIEDVEAIDEMIDDEETTAEEAKDEVPKDEEPKDEEQKQEEPKQEEPKDEEPKQEAAAAVEIDLENEDVDLVPDLRHVDLPDMDQVHIIIVDLDPTSNTISTFGFH